MRKTSIKTLSFALSLLLVVTAICCLSFSVWAETEAVLGDLNGDAQVSAEDIAILEAVLNGSQSADPDVDYDISGNWILDSADLIVLKNMVDPSQPALADKLANGTTDDALRLTESAEGGALQGAVVRGDSTKALEMNGNTLTIRFAEAQNWSNLSALSMDTLWVSGNRTIAVSLLDADGNVLGIAGSATAEENGWSSVVVSIDGVAATQRKSVGGYVISTTEDAQFYIDNLSLVEKELPTRAEMEAALVEIAWDWYLKGSSYEYDSTALNSDTQHLNHPLSGYSGGKTRLDLFPSLENATSQTSVFSVCSGFAYDLYKVALDYPILGAKLNTLTMTLWRNSSYYPADSVGSYDMTVLRWHDQGQNKIYHSEDEKTLPYKIVGDQVEYQNWYTKQEVLDFFSNWETNFRPGDIIVSDAPGHTVVYIGNGIIMHVNGAKYYMEDKTATEVNEEGEEITIVKQPAGTDPRELDGAITYDTFEHYFLTPNGAGKTWLDRRLDYPEDGSGKVLSNGTIEHNHLVVIRPLDLLTTDDGDGNPANDLMDPAYVLQTGILETKVSYDVTNEVKTSDYGITDSTVTRMQYPAMNIDRTVNITPYGTAVKGDTITYTVAITNNSNNEEYAAFYGDADGVTYENLVVTENVPANTQLVEAPGAIIDGDTLRWNVTIPAGETAELTYTVKVTGEIGDKIVSGNGWVNNIPSNTITNIIGGEKLSDPCLAALTTLYNAGADSWGIDTTADNGTRLAEKIYKSATGKTLALPEVQEIMDIFFSEYEYTTTSGYYQHSSGVTRYMYTLRENPSDAKYQTYFDMLVPGYYGGMWCYTDEFNGERRINELREEYLEPGDILIYMDLNASTDYGATSQARTVEGYTVLVYLGNDCYASLDSKGNLTAAQDGLCRTSAFTHDLFVCLRPSQAFDDLCNSAGYTVTWVNADGAILETDENVLPGTIPSFEGDTPTMEADGEKEYTFADWTPAVCVVTGDKTYTAVYTHRDLTDGKLTEAELNILANITPEAVKADITSDIISHLGNVAPWIYRQAGINYNAIATSGNRAGQIQSTYYTATEFFSGNSTAGWKIKDTINAPYKTMLVTNAYGGEAMVNAPAFDINYLQVGDIFCAAFDRAITGASATYYYTYLYQGNGKFLLISADSAVYQLEDVLNAKYADTQLGWSYFYVIRPENYNGATRDITLRSLTDAEEYTLSKLTYGINNQNIQNTVPALYKAAGIDITMMRNTAGNISAEYVRNFLFNNSAPRVPIAASDDPAASFYHKMAVACYGGSYLPYELSIADAVAEGMLQIGDIIAGSYPCTYVDADGKNQTKKPYFTALYQGEGMFLLMYAEAYDIEAGAYVIANVPNFSAAALDALNPYYYYTLRPEKLVAETQDAYTVTWKNEDGTTLETDQTAAFTLPTYDGETPVKAPDAQYTYTFAGWAPLFTSVNSDVTYTAVYTEETRTYTVTWLNEDGSVLATSTVPYGTVPTYSGETPTKAGANGYTYTFAGWDKELTEVTGDVAYTAVYSYVRELTAHKLTEEELDILANITPEDVKAGKPGSNLSAAGPWIYQQANITYNAYATSGNNAGTVLTTYNTATAFFSGSANAKWTLRNSVSAPYTTMMVPNSYGGTRMSEEFPAFDMNYLQVGDLFCGMYTYFTNAEQTTTGNIYATYLYQGKGENGEGKFLLIDKNNAAVFTLEEVLSSTYTYTDGVAYGWGCYYVIRPENYNSATRDITLRNLTDAEKYALSKLTTSQVGFSSYHLKGNVNKIYGLVGINTVIPDSYSSSTENTRDKLFTSTNPRVPAVAGEDAAKRYTQRMMVACYGGSLLADTVTLTDAIANGTLQIGDIVAGIFADTYTVDDATRTGNTQFTALYQGIDTATGKGKFVIQYRDFITSTSSGGYNSVTVEMYADEIDDRITTYYYTLRPSNLAIAGDDSAFTVTWVNEDGTVLETDENVAVLTHPSYNGTTPTKAGNAQFTYIFTGWTPIMTPVNSDVTYKAVYTEVANPTVTWVDADGTVLETDTVPYGTVPTYDGATPTKTKEGYTYTFEGWDKEVVAATADVTYTATYSYIRELTAHLLTDAEMAVLATLTPEDIIGKFKYNNLDTVGPWLYKQISIDDGDAFSKSVHGMKGTLLHSKGAYVTGNTNYNATFGPMLVTDAWGGTDYNRFELNIDSLQIGDLFCSSFFGSVNGNVYYVFLYQGKGENGEGKFLHINKDDADVYTTAQVMEMTAMFAGETEGETIEEGWTYWYVIRPENYGGNTARDIALRSLTDAEKYALSNLTTGAKSKWIHTTVPAYYKAAGITITMAGSKLSQEGVRNQLFVYDEDAGTRIPFVGTDDVSLFYQKMMLPCYGGELLIDNSTIVEAANTILQIGDIIAGAYKDADASNAVSNFTALYQGEDQFLVDYFKWDSEKGKQVEQVTTMTAQELGSLTFRYFYSLRPENLAD